MENGGKKITGVGNLLTGSLDKLLTNEFLYFYMMIEKILNGAICETVVCVVKVH